MTATVGPLIIGFHGHHIEVLADSEPLATIVSTRLRHLLVASDESIPVILQLMLRQHGPEYIELRDSRDCCAAGSVAHVAHELCARLIAAFAAGDPDLLWLHAAAAARGPQALVVAGRSGVGKSTLVAWLVRHGWSLLADDATPIQDGCLVLPLPFTPEIRTRAPMRDARPPGPVERLKVNVRVSSCRVAREATPLRTIVCPQYVSDRTERPVLQALTPVAAAQLLLTECLRTDASTTTAYAIFQIARRARCYRLVYGPGTAVARVAGLLDHHLTDPDPTMGLAQH